MKLFSLRRMEVDFWYSVVAAHVSLRLVPKFLDAVDMAFLFDECFRFWESITEKRACNLLSTSCWISVISSTTSDKRFP